MIKYLGSKRKLLPWILEAIGPARGRSALDLFSGTARVGRALKQAGFAVTANDHNVYALHLARCYVEADRERLSEPAARIIAELNSLPGEDGPFTETYCREARYLKPKNGQRVDAIRRRLRELDEQGALSPELLSVLLTSLIEAADRVDSTCGVQMAFLKQWAARAENDLELRLPELVDRAPAGGGRALNLDALDAARAVSADVAYVDPPYNQHSYLGNYHVWETLCRGDFPEVYGVARKRVDVKERKSAFNRKRDCRQALADVVGALQANTIVVSFSDEGYLALDDIVALLETRGRVTAHRHDYQRYVGARIGIYNPQGEKVGRVSHTTCREHLFVVDVNSDPAVVEPDSCRSVAHPG